MNLDEKNYDNFLVLHPLLEKHEFDKYKFPIIKKDEFEDSDFKNIEIVNLSNIKNVKNKQDSFVIMFNYDKILDRLWKNPHKYLLKLYGFKAVCTPDYSIYNGMNYNDIRFNVYRNRWFGCFLQEHGYKVIPTVQWGDESTYDLCFSGIEKNSVVCISTLGCTKNNEFFLKGFNEMRKRIQPQLIIVFGKFIDGMKGKFISFDYTDSFNKNNLKYKQTQLFDSNFIYEIKENHIYG